MNRPTRNLCCRVNSTSEVDLLEPEPERTYDVSELPEALT